MRRNPRNVSARVDKVLNKLIVLLFHAGLSVATIADVLVNRGLYTPRSIIYISLIMIAFTAYGVMRFFNLKNVNNYPLIYLAVYHLMFVIGFGLLAPAYTPFLFMWFILLYNVYYFFGRSGFVFSAFILLLTLLASSFRVLPYDAPIYDYVQLILIQGGSISIMGLFFIETESVADDDRKKILSTMDKAQVERQRLMSLINSMGDGVISTDENGVIKLYNAAALNILDTNAKLEEKNISDVLNVIDQSAKMVNLVAEASKITTNLLSTDYLLVYPDGEKINLYLNVSPIKLSFQENIERGFIISFRDITREKSLEEERNEFISVVSHELRTPIAITEANISNAKFMAEKGTDLGAIKTSLEAAHKQSQFLANMINDLATLSRAERGKLDMVTETISPKEIMQSLVDDYTKEAETKGLEFVTEISSSTPESIISNRLYVREILQNFITNAVKYTKEGSVTVSLSGEEGGIKFSVKDTGIGISKSDQKRVFDKFFRSEDFRTRESSGTGLGLYVTKKLMKLINATIDLTSKLNEGSTFTVHIPNLDKNTKIGE